MSNKYGIPHKDLKKIRERDKTCVYCHKTMVSPSINNQRGDWATIEHLNHLPPWNDSFTVVICCGSCNSSRGKKKLLDWFKTTYCIEKNINEKTVTKPVREYVYFIESFIDNLSWTFAKTIPETPHYYVIKDELSDNDKRKFDDFNKYIKRNGYSKLFDSKRYNYLNIGEFKYWIIDNVLNKERLNHKKEIKK